MKYGKYIMITIFMFLSIGCLDRAEAMIVNSGKDCKTTGCKANEECNISTGLCEAFTKCNTHNDCNNGEYCSDDSKCKLGCYNNDSCSKDEICNLEKHQCIIVRKCIKHTDCKNGEYCNSESICISGCVNNNECEADQVCNNHNCEKPECRVDDECAKGQYCEKDFTCKLGCGSDKGCDVTEYCELITHACLTETCMMTGCPDGKKCNDQTGLCEDGPECYSNDDCNNGKKCNPNTQKCVRNYCESTADCPPRLECNIQENSCQLKSNCNGPEDCKGLDCQFGFCTGCVTDEQCPDGQSCKEVFAGVTYCEPEGQIGGCITNSNCPEGKVCDIPSGQCHYADGHCDNDDDCKSDLVCRNILGRSICQGCSDPQDCFMGEMCMGEFCMSGGGCETNDDCRIPGQICFQGSCVGAPTP